LPPIYPYRADWVVTLILAFTANLTSPELTKWHSDEGWASQATSIRCELSTSGAMK